MRVTAVQHEQAAMVRNRNPNKACHFWPSNCHPTLCPCPVAVLLHSILQLNYCRHKGVTPTNTCLLLTVLLGSVMQLLVHRFPHELPRGGGSCLLRRLPLAAGQQATGSDGPQQAAWKRGRGGRLVETRG